MLHDSAAQPDVQDKTGVVVPISSKLAKLADGSEDAIANYFTERQHDNMRFDHTRGQWSQWDGMRWKLEETELVIDLLREYARELSRGQRSISKASVARGAESFARAHRAHAVTSDIWDKDPWLLGTPGGTVDLKTGKLRDARREDYISKITSCSPELGEPTEWLRFLDEATGSDRALIRFIQVWFGYCLTGITSEQALMFLHGPGGNGKSIVLNVMQNILGDYAEVASMETFTVWKHDRHPADVAKFAGARLVVASENEEQHDFAASRIKLLTGGDPITARFMRKNPFTYRPVFKLMFAGNHEPQFRIVDPAIQRRLNIVPFTNTPKAPDKHLQQKLEAESGRILSWAIQGCLDWQEHGLTRAPIVSARTETFFKEQDTLGGWLDEFCDVDHDAQETVEQISTLMAGYNDYLQGSGCDPVSTKRFGTLMKAKGFRSATKRINGSVAKVYLGIIINSNK